MPHPPRALASWEHPEGILVENLKLRTKGSDQDIETAVRRVSDGIFAAHHGLHALSLGLCVMLGKQAEVNGGLAS